MIFLYRLKEKLTNAREVRYRLQADKYRQTMRMFYDFFLQLSKLYQFIMTADSRMRCEKDKVLTLMSKVRNDCLWFAQKESGIENTIKMQLLGSVQRYMDSLYTSMYTELLETKQAFEEATDVFTQKVSSTLDQLVWLKRMNETIWIKMSQLPAKFVVLEEDLFDDLMLEVMKAKIPQEFRLDYDRAKSLLLYARIDCTWCLTTTAPPTGQSEGICYWCDSYNKPLGVIIETGIREFMNATLKYMLSEIRMAVANVTMNVMNEISVIADQLETTLSMLREDLNITNVTDATTATIATTAITSTIATTVTASYNISISTLETILCLWNTTIHELDFSLVNVAELLSLSHDNMVAPLQTSSGLLEEMLRLLSPKCESELEKLYNEYLDTHTRLADVLNTLRQQILQYNTTYTIYQYEYINNNLTLSSLAEIVSIRSMQSSIMAQAITLEGLLEGRVLAVHSIDRHINNIYYWLMAQIDDAHLANESMLWKQFDLTVSD